jgi:ABC-type sugar transport system ATPase subunit
MAVADQVAVLRRGRLEQLGEPLEVYRRPATRYVGRFVGSPAMNLLDPADPLLRAHGTGELAGAAEVGVRPEDVTLTPTAVNAPTGPDAPDAADGGLWTIGSAQPTGVSWICTLRRGTDTLTALRRDRPGGPGDLVRVELSGAALHLFDAEGVRLPGPPDGHHPHVRERETA